MAEEDNFLQLKEIYSKKGICLALGAGISVKSGIPLWSALLCDIFNHIFKNDKVFNDFQTNNYSYEAFASFLKISAKTNFTEIVREELYKEFKKNITSSNEIHIKEEIEKNLTLRSIGSFCAYKEPGKAAYTSNPNVHGIINFNIDRLLRVYTTIKFNKNILRTVERPSAGRTPGKINVYHIHGMMRFDTERNSENESPDKLVFAEDEYYSLFNDAANLFNYSFLYLLREYSFLFIGLSMQDLNLRRLLHLSITEIREGYRSEKISGDKLEDKLNKANKHYAILKEPGYELTKTFLEVTLLKLGVKIIWINDYAEIQNKMKDIYSVSGDWEAVY